MIGCERQRSRRSVQLCSVFVRAIGSLTIRNNAKDSCAMRLFVETSRRIEDCPLGRSARAQLEVAEGVRKTQRGSVTEIPTFEIVSDARQVRSNFRQWRLAVASLFDTKPLGKTFEATISSFALGNLLIGQSTANAQQFRRDEKVIQRSQIDHMMVQLYTEGGFVGHAEGVPIEVLPGDICCFDLAFGFETIATDFSNITIIIPKSALQPLIKSDHFHGTVLRAGEAANSLLGVHMRELLRTCATIRPGEMETVTRVTAEVVRLCLRMPRRQRLAPEAPAGSLIERVRAFIGENLADPELDTRMVCEAFAVSRATLYRHFAPLGGVASVIRNWRLSIVFGELERNRTDPLHAISSRNGFSNQVACARSFKTRYGLSPSAFRSLRAIPTLDSGHSSLRVATAGDGSALTQWMTDLGRQVDALR